MLRPPTLKELQSGTWPPEYPKLIITPFGAVFVNSAIGEKWTLRVVIGAVIFMASCAVFGISMLALTFVELSARHAV